MDLLPKSPFCTSSGLISPAFPISRHRLFTYISLPVPPGAKFRRLKFRCELSDEHNCKCRSESLVPVFSSSIGNTALELGKNIAKPLALSLLFAAVGFLPFPRQRLLVLAAPPATVTSNSNISHLDHEFSDYTRKLLESVSVLLQKIDDVKLLKGNVDDVDMALRGIKLKRKELQKEVLGVLNSELSLLRKEKVELVKRSEEILDAALAVGKERDKLLEKNTDDVEVNEKLANLEKKINIADEEYNFLWEKIGNLDDAILRRETLTYSIGIRELSFIERESELLVERFRLWLKQGAVKRYCL